MCMCVCVCVCVCAGPGGGGEGEEEGVSYPCSQKTKEREPGNKARKNVGSLYTKRLWKI